MVSAVDELIEEFADLDEHEACQVLDELGRELPEIPESVYVDENLVPGCQSRVWLVCGLSDAEPATVELQADSDAIIVKGLVKILLEMYVGRTPQQVLETDYAQIFESMGLSRLITPQRKNGLFSMVRAIRGFAAQAAGVEIDDAVAGGPEPTLSKIRIEPWRSVENIATEFPVLQQQLPSGGRPVFLDSGASAQKPQQVIEKEREVEQQYYANAFRGRYYFGQRVDDEIEATRVDVARLIGAQRSDEVIFTAGTTMSLNMVAFGWGRKFLKPGDEVVVTEMEHHANFVPWQTVAKQTGATLRIVPITDEGLLDLNAFETTLNERTAIVAFSSMSNVLGTINPVADLCRLAHKHGAIAVVDAAQSVPHEVTDVVADEADFLTFSGHKLYGPSGVGVLYGRRELLEQIDPLLYGGHMIERVGRETSSWAAPPAKFEAGTPAIVQIIGLGAAVDFVNSVGLEAIKEWEGRLQRETYQRLSQIDGLRIFGPGEDQRGAIVSFAIDGVAAEDLAVRLDQRGVFTRHGHHCTMVLHDRLGVAATTRASFGLYNTRDDVEALVSAVEFAVDDVRR